MPKLTGPFSIFADLDKIPLEEINFWLKSKQEIHILQNYIANRILYPQTVAVSAEELEIDLAILREALKREPQIIYKQNESKITIPAPWEQRFPPLKKLVVNILDVLRLTGITLIYHKNSGNILIGSVVSPIIRKGKTEANLYINNKPFKFKKGSIVMMPFLDHHLNLILKDAYINETKVEAATVSGGTLGLIIDLRNEER